MMGFCWCMNLILIQDQTDAHDKQRCIVTSYFIPLLVNSDDASHYIKIIVNFHFKNKAHSG